MSKWTHIVASIDIDTYREKEDIKGFVEELIKGAPEISGSEGPADVFVNVLSGHNISTTQDCERCQYFVAEKAYDGEYCSLPENETFQCPYGEYQTRVVITVIGDLRDREPETTKREWKEFKKYIDKVVGQGDGIRNCSCRIK